MADLREQVFGMSTNMSFWSSTKMRRHGGGCPAGRRHPNRQSVVASSVVAVLALATPLASGGPADIFSNADDLNTAGLMDLIRPNMSVLATPGSLLNPTTILGIPSNLVHSIAITGNDLAADLMRRFHAIRGRAINLHDMMTQMRQQAQQAIQGNADSLPRQVAQALLGTDQADTDGTEDPDAAPTAQTALTDGLAQLLGLPVNIVRAPADTLINLDDYFWNPETIPSLPPKPTTAPCFKAGSSVKLATQVTVDKDGNLQMTDPSVQATSLTTTPKPTKAPRPSFQANVHINAPAGNLRRTTTAAPQGTAAGQAYRGQSNAMGQMPPPSAPTLFFPTAPPVNPPSPPLPPTLHFWSQSEAEPQQTHVQNQWGSEGPVTWSPQPSPSATSSQRWGGETSTPGFGHGFGPGSGSDSALFQPRATQFAEAPMTALPLPPAPRPLQAPTPTPPQTPLTPQAPQMEAIRAMVNSLPVEGMLYGRSVQGEPLTFTEESARAFKDMLTEELSKRLFDDWVEQLIAFHLTNPSSGAQAKAGAPALAPAPAPAKAVGEDRTSKILKDTIADLMKRSPRTGEGSANSRSTASDTPTPRTAAPRAAPEAQSATAIAGRREGGSANEANGSAADRR